ncbi:MAG TPA: MarR family transcriptional regulator [Gaiellaceae bacterium]
MTSRNPTSKEERDHVDRFLEQIVEILPALDPAVEGIVDRTMGISRRLKRMLEETLADYDLTYGEWQVLGSLRQAGPPYRRSPGRLASRTELSSGAMTNRLDRLEKAGLVERSPDPDDRRAVLVELTPKGKKVYEDAVEVQARKEALVAAALNDDEKEQLNALLRRLMITLERREKGEAADA